MFFLKLFCDTQEMHKLLIRESFDDYKYFKKNWKEKYPTLTGLMILNDYNNLNEETKEEGPSFEDVQRRALGINASGDDVVSLQGPLAASAGFGIGAGLGYEKG